RTLGQARALLLGAQLFGLVDGDAALERELLDRARRELHAAPGGAVGLGQHQRHVVACGEDGLERAGGKFGRTGEGDAQAACPGSSGGHHAVMRAFLASLALMRPSLSCDRYSTKTLPSRWSISCCTHTASKSSASNSKDSPFSFRARTFTRSARVTFS